MLAALENALIRSNGLKLRKGGNVGQETSGKISSPEGQLGTQVDCLRGRGGAARGAGVEGEPGHSGSPSEGKGSPPSSEDIPVHEN